MKTRPTPRLFSSIEILEPRVAPAGLVTATFAGGALTLTGDLDDNDVQVGFDGQESFRLLGNMGTMISLNGAAAAASVVIAGALRSVDAQMGAGNDKFAINLLTVSGSISVEGGAGNDVFHLGVAVIQGGITFDGGADDDSLTSNATLARVGGPFIADLGDGANTVNIDAATLILAGPATITGGAGIDNFQFPADALFASKGLTIDLGGDDNVLSMTGALVRITGALKITHLDHAGTTTTSIAPSGQLSVTGGLTVNTGMGHSATTISAGGNMEIAGGLTINGTAGDDMVNFTTAGPARVKGGVQFNLGDGINTSTFGGDAAILSSLSINGGASFDTVSFAVTSARLGTVTLALGDGSNSAEFSTPELRATGLFKMTGGAGEDVLTFTNTDTRLAKGVQYFGVSNFDVFNCTGAAFQSGPVEIQYGENAAGECAVNISALSTTINGAFTVGGKSGRERVIITSEVFATGPFTTSLGDGGDFIKIDVASLRLGKVSITSGAGNDDFVWDAGEATIAGLSMAMNHGNNELSFNGGELIISGPIQITSGSGDDSFVFNNDLQRLAKGATISMGDGTSVVTFLAKSMSIGGAFKYSSGNHPPATTSTMTIGGILSLNVGAFTAVLAGGDNTVQIASTGPARVGSVKVTGGAGDDLVSALGTAFMTLGPVTFLAGDGDNTLTTGAYAGTSGPLKYVGGSGTDKFVTASPLGTAGPVKLDLGAGAYDVQFLGSGPSRFGGPISLKAANLAGETGTLLMQTAAYAAPVKIQTGDGPDTVTMLNSVFSGAFAIDTRGGDDTVQVEPVTALGMPTIFRNTATFLLGDGADTLHIGSNTPADHAEFKKVARFDGGPGTDTAHISAALFANVYTPGQPVVSGFETED